MNGMKSRYLRPFEVVERICILVIIFGIWRLFEETDASCGIAKYLEPRIMLSAFSFVISPSIVSIFFCSALLNSCSEPPPDAAVSALRFLCRYRRGHTA